MDVICDLSIDEMELKWDKLCGDTTDKNAAMIGQRNGMAPMVCDKVRENGGEFSKIHCTIQQEALSAKQSNLAM